MDDESPMQTQSGYNPLKSRRPPSATCLASKWKSHSKTHQVEQNQQSPYATNEMNDVKTQIKIQSERKPHQCQQSSYATSRALEQSLGV